MESLQEHQNVGHPLRRLLPSYTILPLLSMLFFNSLVYYGAPLLSRAEEIRNFSTELDSAIPFSPELVSIYILAFVQWVVGYIIITRESPAVCYRYVTAEIVAKLLCFACFLLVPTTMERGKILLDDGMWGQITGLIYALDKPSNLFPSIHCLESWFCFRGSLALKKVPRLYAPVMFAFSVLVFASTVLVKQHVLVDIFGGILVAEAGLLLTRKWDAGALFRRLPGGADFQETLAGMRRKTGCGSEKK